MYHKAIVYDYEIREYAMYLDDELIGFARTYQEAELTLDELVYELLSGSYHAPRDHAYSRRGESHKSCTAW